MSSDPNIRSNIAEIQNHLGSRSAYARCMARLGSAIHESYVGWFEDESRRSRDYGLAAAALSEWYGQMVGTMIAATGSKMPELTDDVLAIVRKAIEQRIADAAAGRVPTRDEF